jgi:FKBP-type peptidyl-prolyl cis-trans isomerase
MLRFFQLLSQLQLALVPIFSVFLCPNLESAENPPPYVFSKALVLDSFFRELFENTPAGYVLYGQKPIYLGTFPALENAIPGSKEHSQAVNAHLALKFWKEIAPEKHLNYILTAHKSKNNPQQNEFLIINCKEFLHAVQTNLLLFQYEFGINTTPENLLETLLDPANSFYSLFKKQIALQGIVLGYGTKNAITYEKGSAAKKQLTSNIPLSPPHQAASAPKNEEEFVQKIGNTPKDFSYYKPLNQNDHLKIPFSFHANSSESKHLIHEYRKNQKQIDLLLNDKKFLNQVILRLGGKPNLFSNNVKIMPAQLGEFFTENERKTLPHLVVKSISNTFHDEITPSFIEGMKDANTKKWNPDESLDIKFLEILKLRSLASNSTTDHFFKSIDSEENVECLIPHRLYYRTLKDGHPEKTLTSHHSSIKLRYLLEDSEGTPLTGSYSFDEFSELDIHTLIPGLAHGLLGMKEGEIREIYIHPDFAYGTDLDFAKGRVVKAKAELVQLGKTLEKEQLPFLKPFDVIHYAPNISSCAEFTRLQNKYAYFCGKKVWTHYRKASSVISLDAVLEELKKGSTELLSDREQDILLKFEWLLYSH